jgi:glycosyltransferase involved in cell wall biosynthesis
VLYQRRDVRSASMLHATSAMEAENLRQLGFRQPIAVIGNGVDVPWPAARLRADDRHTALFLSRIHPKKGLLDLVTAWAIVRPPGWRVVIAGPDEGGHERDVRASVTRHGLEESFTFAGEVDDDSKWAYYAAADLFLLPSYSENFGTVVMEALASGVPVITTRATPWEELQTRRCGWWIEATPTALAAALTMATSLDDAERVAMGARGRAMAEERFGWSRVGAEMRAAYEWLLGGGDPPPFIRTM